MMVRIKGKMTSIVVFDAYGTIFDVNSAVMRHVSELGDLALPLADLWRRKQLEYTWILTLAMSHRSFWDLTKDSLDFALESIAPAHQSLRTQLLEAYLTLDPYPDVLPALKVLRDMGCKTGILTNADYLMLSPALRTAGLEERFDAVLSAEEVGSFKTDPVVYRLIHKKLDIRPEATTFISSNRWDIVGAQTSGFHTIWLNRAGLLDEYRHLQPAAVISSLDQLFT